MKLFQQVQDYTNLQETMFIVGNVTSNQIGSLFTSLLITTYWCYAEQEVMLIYSSEVKEVFSSPQKASSTSNYVYTKWHAF